MMSVMLVAMLLACQPSPALAEAPAVLRLTHAELAFADGGTAPASGWRAAELPQVFSALPNAGDRTTWLRLQFNLPALPTEPLVLLVQRVVLTAEFRLNGSVLNPGVRFQKPGGRAGTQMLNWPHWIVLPSGLFRAGPNELLIRLRGDRVTPAWISGISIGTPEVLRGEYLWRDIPQRVVPQAVFVMLLASLVFGLRLWWRERQPLQGEVVITVLLWLILMGTYLQPDLPLPWHSALGLISVLWIAFHWALLHLLWRLSGGGWRWFPKALFIGSIVPLVAALVVLITPPQRSSLGFLMLPTTVLRCMTTVMLLRWAWRERTWSALLLTGSELLWFAGPVQLLLVVLRVVPPDPFMLSPGSALPLFLVMLWQGAQRLARQHEEAALQKQRAVMEERQRLMLDMHDGLGSQLITALRLARRDDVPRSELAQLIQEALQDLRLILEAQDGAAQDLHTLLQQWVQRNQLRIEASGPRLNWSASPVTGPRPLTPRESLQVLRILQEALSNALQHSGSSTVDISLQPTPCGHELRVSDDGTRADTTPHAPRPGRGLQSMQQRAHLLGAELDVRMGDGHGTVVRLLLPSITPAP
jgi:signal transduction histidine kinase